MREKANQFTFSLVLTLHPEVVEKITEITIASMLGRFPSELMIIELMQEAGASLSEINRKLYTIRLETAMGQVGSLN